MNNIKFRYPDFKISALTLSYDDGVIFDQQLVDILDKYDIKCTFNLDSGFLLDSNERCGRRLNKEEAIKLFYNSKHEIAVHGYNHKNLTCLSLSEAILEIKKDKEILSKTFNRNVCGMAYAYGAYNDQIISILKSLGIKYSRTTEDSLNFNLPNDWFKLKPTCHHDNPNLFALVDEFLKFKSDKINLFYLWGHSYEFNDNNNWDLIEEFCKRVAHNDKVWYATNIEILEYIEAINNVKLMDDKKTLVNDSNLDIYVNINGKNFVLEKHSIIRL